MHFFTKVLHFLQKYYILKKNIKYFYKILYYIILYYYYIIQYNIIYNIYMSEMKEHRNLPFGTLGRPLVL